MTISTETRKAGPFTCDGVAITFPFAFKVFTSADVRVVLLNASNVESDLTLTTDYGVSLNADQDANPGGTVTTVTAYATGNFITIASKVANTQATKLTNSGGFYPTVINDALDRSTIQIQQLAEEVSRSVKTAISSTTTPDQLLSSINASASAAASSASSASASATAAGNSATSASGSATAAANSAASVGFTLGSVNTFSNKTLDSTCAGNTAAQFDGTTKLATTLFVKNALGNSSGVLDVAGNVTLTSANAGNLISISGAGAKTITLPDISTCPSGSRIDFVNYGTVSATISRSGTNVIVSTSQGNANSISLLPGDTVSFISLNGSVGWYIAGGSFALNDSKVKNICKAWVNFDGTSAGTITPRASFNISSVTKNGTGDYTLNIASGVLADANYVAAGVINQAVLGNMTAGWDIYNTDTSSMTATSLRINTGSMSIGVAADLSLVSILIFGN